MVCQPNFPNAGGLKTLQPGDVLMTYNSGVYVYLGYYSGSLEYIKNLTEGYLYVPINVYALRNYRWRTPGLVTDVDILYPDKEVPAWADGCLTHRISPEGFNNLICAYTKNVKKFYELALHIDLTPIQDKIQRLGNLVRLGDKKIK